MLSMIRLFIGEKTNLNRNRVGVDFQIYDSLLGIQKLGHNQRLDPRVDQPVLFGKGLLRVEKGFEK